MTNENWDDYEWWDHIYEDAKEDARALGFDIESICFSGFWAQGDGASWTGGVRIADFIEAHIKPEMPAYSKWVVFLEILRNEDPNGKLNVTLRDSRYCHEQSMRIANMDDVYFITEEDTATISNGVLAGASVRELANAIDAPAMQQALEDWALDEARCYAKKIYRHLEDEYDYLETTHEEEQKEHS